MFGKILGRKYRNFKVLKTMATTFTNVSNVIRQLSEQRNLDMGKSQFENFCTRTFDGATESVHDRTPGSLFRSVFDLDGDGQLSTKAEQGQFKEWLENLLAKRKSALVVVDVQNDFIDGSLSIKNGPARQDPEAIIDPINHLIKSIPFDLVVYTHDWHPPNHISFFERIHSRPVASNANKNGGWKVGDTVPFLVNGRVSKQSVWPTHCVENTQGAQLHPRLKSIDDENRLLRIFKGQNPDVEHYSAFYDNERKGETSLRRELGQREITDLYICGLAYDVCVSWTALDALKLGYRTTIIDDCTRGLDLQCIEQIRNGIREQYGSVVGSAEIADLVSGKRVQWNWAYAAAVRMFKK